MQGVPTLEALCEAVRTQGQDGLALTDTNGLYGAIRFLEVARDAGLKPILGAELVHEARRAVLLARTPIGYANLCRILSARHCDEAFDFTDTVARHRAGLVILSNDRTALTGKEDKVRLRAHALALKRGQCRGQCIRFHLRQPHQPCVRAVKAARVPHAGALRETRPVWFDGSRLDTPVYHREKLPLDAVLQGPAILEQMDATTVLEPGDRAAGDADGNILVEIGERP